MNLFSISFDSEEWDTVSWEYDELEPDELEPDSYRNIDEDLRWVGSFIYSIVLCDEQRFDPWSGKLSSMQ